MEHDPAHIAHEKALLRREARGAAAMMNREAREQASARIRALLEAAPWARSASCVMVFEAMEDEPEISGTAAAWLACGKTVCYPRVDWERVALTPVAVPRMDFPRLTGRHGLREPAPDATGWGGREVAAEEIELVIVPGVAFDARGGRLGRGGGFYDRFLTALVERAEDGGAFAAGVCFECQRVARVPTAGHDVRVHAVVTEKGVFGEGNGTQRKQREAGNAEDGTE